MRTSQSGIDLIKEFEGCSLKAYWDYKGYSIGYGHLGATAGQTITKEQAEALLISDLPSYEKKVEKYDSIYHWKQYEFDALVSYCYNIGSIKGLVDDGKRSREEIIADWPNHDKADGKHLDSLKARRLKELEVFKGGYVKSMTEKQITICGHGSGTPSLKVMYDYLEKRYNSKADNGKRKGVIKVMRLKLMSDSGRKAFVNNYKTILGRNIYNQNRREYCYNRYKDGNYYSDCSSSGIKTYEKCGYSFPWTLNTAGIYESSLFEEVPVEIRNGHITNPEVLKVGDALLFVGNDPSRPLQIGHVEFVYSMPDVVFEIYPKWVKDGDVFYYRIAEGKNAHGWKDIEGADGNVYRYYFDSTGKMLTGWQLIEGRWYFFHDTKGSGREGALYVSDENGAQDIGVF
ncbi:MAG: glycoside hydrolase family protein [Oribacterium sp.]|nr:glycoside hydrolase family protein [Oribacterium sp.]